MKLKKKAIAMGIGIALLSGVVHAYDSKANKDKTEVVKEVISKTGKSSKTEIDPKVIEHGQNIFNGSCVGCHGMTGEGGVGPKLAGRKPEYIKEKLIKYRKGSINSPMASMMTPVASGLSEEDIEGLSIYISNLK